MFWNSPLLVLSSKYTTFVCHTLTHNHGSLDCGFHASLDCGIHPRLDCGLHVRMTIRLHRRIVCIIRAHQIRGTLYSACALSTLSRTLLWFLWAGAHSYIWTVLTRMRAMHAHYGHHWEGFDLARELGFLILGQFDNWISILMLNLSIADVVDIKLSYRWRGRY